MNAKNIFHRASIPALALALALPVLSVSPASAARVVVHAGVRPVVRTTIVVGRPRPVRRAVYIGTLAAALVDFNVKPRATQVYVNGHYRGTCDDFDGYPQKLALHPGVHRIELVTPEGESIAREVRLVAGTEIDLDLDLREE